MGIDADALIGKKKTKKPEAPDEILPNAEEQTKDLPALEIDETTAKPISEKPEIKKPEGEITPKEANQLPDKQKKEFKPKVVLDNDVYKITQHQDLQPGDKVKFKGKDEVIESINDQYFKIKGKYYSKIFDKVYKDGKPVFTKADSKPTEKPIVEPVKTKIETPEPVKTPNESIKQEQTTTERTKPQVSKRLTVYDIPVKHIKTDLSNLQNREKPYSEESVQRITDAVEKGNFNIEEFDPILLWKNIEGDYLVLSGHSRLEAFNRLSKNKKEFGEIPAKIIEAKTLPEARQIAKRSNTLGTRETAVERARYYREKRIEGVSKKDIDIEANKYEGKGAARKIVNLSYLNPNGNTLQTYKDFQNSSSSDFNTIDRIANYIGELRSKHPELTDEHEEELYNWLYNDGMIEKFNNKIKFLESVDKFLHPDTFSKDKPIGVRTKTIQSSESIEIDTRLKSLRKERSELEKERRKFEEGKTLTPIGLTPEEYLNEFTKKIDNINKEIIQATKDLRKSVEADRLQGDLFSQITEEIEDEKAENIVKRTNPKELEELAQDIESKEKSKSGITEKEIEETIDNADAQLDLLGKPGVSSETIEDFGEKLGGARKDYYSRLAKSDEYDVNTDPFSRIFPKPDYQKLLDSGTKPEVVAWVRVLRDSIPHPSNRYYKRLVVSIKEIAKHLLETNDISRFENELKGLSDYNKYKGNAELYTRFGHDVNLKNISISFGETTYYVDGKPIRKNEYWITAGKGNPTFRKYRRLAIGTTKEEALTKFGKLLEEKKNEVKEPKRTKFTVYWKRSNPKIIYIGKKVGRNYLELKSFDSQKAAQDYLKNNYDDLVAILERKKYIPRARRQVNNIRSGFDFRDGRNITPEEFQKSFGLRGVEFGNWVSKSGERQELLNKSYDAFRDLAQILKIPTQAVSLEGSLGLGFGSRGSGGKDAPSAHFEPVKNVINLTRKAGAGSLAHEWFHALDYYLSNEKGHPLSESYSYAKVRPELKQAYQDLLKAIKSTEIIKRSRILDSKRTKAYWNTTREIAARTFESYIIEKLNQRGYSNDYLANIVGHKDYLNDLMKGILDGQGVEDIYPYLTESEIPVVTKAFDNLFEVMKTEKTDKGIKLYEPKAEYGTPKQELKARLEKKLKEPVYRVEKRDDGIGKVDVLLTTHNYDKALELYRNEKDSSDGYDDLVIHKLKPGNVDVENVAEYFDIDNNNIDEYDIENYITDNAKLIHDDVVVSHSYKDTIAKEEKPNYSERSYLQKLYDEKKHLEFSLEELERVKKLDIEARKNYAPKYKRDVDTTGRYSQIIKELKSVKRKIQNELNRREVKKLTGQYNVFTGEEDTPDQLKLFDKKEDYHDLSQREQKLFEEQLAFDFNEDNSEKYVDSKGNGIQFTSRAKPDNPSYRRLKKGEIAKSEARYRKYNTLRFYARKEKISSPEDVAFIFRALENERNENLFLLLTKEGKKPVVHHLTTGTVNSALADLHAIYDLVSRFEADEVWLVHNHPSGNIESSAQDRNLLAKLQKHIKKGVKVNPGIIIDTYKNLYGVFNSELSVDSGVIPSAKDKIPLKAISFSRQAFRDVNIDNSQITSPGDIAKIITESRFNAGRKAMILVLNSSNRVVGKFIATTPEFTKKLADEVKALASRVNGVNVAIAINRQLKESENGFGEKYFKGSGIDLLDILSVHPTARNSYEGYASALHEGVLEPKEEYKSIDQSSIYKTPKKVLDKSVEIYADLYNVTGGQQDIYPDWVRNMVAQNGQEIRKDLLSIWRDTKDRYEEMDKPFKARFTPAKIKYVQASLFETENNPLEFPAETVMQLVARKLNDSMNRNEQLVEFVRRHKGDLPVNTDYYMKSDLYIGKATKQIKELQESITNSKDGFIKRLFDKGFSVDDFGEYLYAKEAIERNPIILKRNGKHAGSGVDTKQAKGVIEKFANTGVEKFEKEFREKITYPMRELLYKGGFIDAKTYEYYKNERPNYVPLKGFDEEDSIEYRLTGNGFSVESKGVLNMEGRGSIANNPFIQALADYENTIVRYEKNLVGQSMLEFIKEAPDLVNSQGKPLFVVSKQGGGSSFNEYGEEDRFNKRFKLKDNEISVWKDGKQHIIKVSDIAIARGMKKLGNAGSIRVLDAFNGWLRNVITLYSPSFMFTNAERDIQEALINVQSVLEKELKLSAGEGLKFTAGLLLEIQRSMRGVFRAERGWKDNEYSFSFKRFDELGGKTGWMTTQTVDEKTREFQKAIKRYKQSGKTRQLAESALKFIGDMNEAIEYGTRVAVFKRLTEHGIDEQRAAQIAKGITVNFNKKGEWGGYLNSLYLFSTAGLGGNRVIYRALKKSKWARRYVYGMMGISLALNIINRLIDKENYEKLQEYHRDSHWIFMLGNGKHFMIKLPYGYNASAVMGNVAADVVLGNETVGGGLSRLFGAVVDGFNPLGSYGDFAQLISPTITDPIVQIAENKNFFGGNIAPEQKYPPYVAENTMYYRSISPMALWAARELNTLSGGEWKTPFTDKEQAEYDKLLEKQDLGKVLTSDERKRLKELDKQYKNVTSGWLDFSPEYIDHVVDFLGGGTLKFVKNTITTGVKTIQGEKIPYRNLPILRKMIGESSNYSIRQMAYTMYDECRRTKYSKKEIDKFHKLLQQNIALGLIDEKRGRTMLRTFNKYQGIQTPKPPKKTNINKKEKVEFIDDVKEKVEFLD